MLELPKQQFSKPGHADAAAEVVAPPRHVLDPLSPQEIRLASATFRTELLRRGVRSVKSTYVDLIERESLGDVTSLDCGPDGLHASYSTPLLRPLRTA